uniref:Uncharacterized protein n=1 Tax=Anguilla anguilla TaxID=7936 RepID=A0A0E9TYQ9_ANGAN
MHLRSCIYTEAMRVKYLAQLCYTAAPGFITGCKQWY